jgi:DNA-directed RNA polymerase specialized sigma24 family protein
VGLVAARTSSRDDVDKLKSEQEGFMETPDLIHAAKSGSLPAFNLLVLENQDRLYSMAYYLTASQSMAEALTQEAVLRTYHHLKRYRRGVFLHWLSKELVWVSRKRIQERSAPVHGRLAWFTNRRNGRFLDDFGATNPGKGIQFALRRLPLEQRLPLVLVEVGGLNFAETCQVLGWGNKKLNRSLAEARLTLQRATSDSTPQIA